MSTPSVTRYFLLKVSIAPAQRTASLIRAVQDLVAGGVLSSGNGNALIATLNNAIKLLEKASVGPAVNKIQAFINQVQAFIQSGKLSSAAGQGTLIDEANRIVAALTS